MKKNTRLITLLIFICIISSSFFMILPFNNLDQENQVNFSSITEDKPLPIDQLAGDGNIPNITAIWFNGSLFNSSIFWNVTSNQLVNITANITSADLLWGNSTYLYYDTNITSVISPIPIRFTNTTDINSAPLDNNSINNVILNGTSVANDFRAVQDDDGILHVVENGSQGILIPYSINLTSLGYDNDFDLQDKVIISMEGRISTKNNTYAGLMIWNWTSNSLVDVSPSWFNTTSFLEKTFTLENSSQFNISHFVNNGNNSRIELFVKVQSPTTILIAIDYISFQVKKDPKQGIYSALIPGLPWDKNNQPNIKSPVFFWINVTDEDGTNSTKIFKHNYSIVDNTPPQVEFSIVNNSYVSGLVDIWINVTDMESGIQNISLSIDKNKSYNQSKIWSYTEIVAQDPNLNNVSFKYSWDVSAFFDYNGTNAPENATHVINFTVWNRAGPINVGIDQSLWESRYETKGNYTVYIDNENPYDPYLNVRSNDEDFKYLNELTNFELANATITELITNATSCANTISSVYNYDDNYHSYHNASHGILMPYALELAEYGISILDDIKFVKFTVAANTSAANSSIEIYNFSSNSLVNVSKLDGSFTTNYTFIISRDNLSQFINETESLRIELFLNASDSLLADFTIFVKYIGIEITYYKKYDWYSDNKIETNMSLRVGGNDEISFEQIKVYANNILIFTFHNSTNLTKGAINYNDYANNYVTFNSSLLPDGTVTIKAIVLDNASNQNITTKQIKVDNSGPLINLNYNNNTAFSNNGGKNWMIDLISLCQDSISEISFVELRINGTVPLVADGQKYQVIKYDNFGNVEYKQENATWYEDNADHLFKYYWNATQYQTNDILNITLYAEDLLSNSNTSIYFISKANYTSNITIERANVAEIGYSESYFLFTILFNNTGNSTLFNFSIMLSAPVGWSYHYQFNQSVYLKPGQTMIINLYILPISTTAGNFSLQIMVKAYSYENSYHEINITKTKILTVLIYQKNYENEILVGLIIFGIILGGIALGVGLHFLTRSIKRTSRKLKIIQDQPATKQKSGKI
ncbi:MAG: hypothetical protein EAX96_17295 [Candidatus Lokiarchaeota archaeon]|nr:hypothetical protein [Candidatus Lokiarchaeota archaeon]